MAKTVQSPSSKPTMKRNQVRVLECLSKSKGPMTRKDISAKTGIDQASLTGYIGPVDPDKRKYNDEKYFTTLVTLGFVKHVVEQNGDGKEHVGHVITASGKKALEKALKEAK